LTKEEGVKKRRRKRRRLDERVTMNDLSYYSP